MLAVRRTVPRVRHTGGGKDVYEIPLSWNGTLDALCAAASDRYLGALSDSDEATVRASILEATA